VDPSILFLGVALLLLVLMFQRGNRQRRELAQVQSGLEPGAQVMTASGLFATVVEVDTDKVTLQTGPGQRSTWDRRAVARIVAPAASTPGASPDSETGSEADSAPDTLTEGGAEDGVGAAEPRSAQDTDPPPQRPA
jgi:preprotein translocase subunit YajC